MLTSLPTALQSMIMASSDLESVLAFACCCHLHRPALLAWLGEVQVVWWVPRSTRAAHLLLITTWLRTKRSSMLALKEVSAGRGSYSFAREDDAKDTHSCLAMGRPSACVVAQAALVLVAATNKYHFDSRSNNLANAQLTSASRLRWLHLQHCRVGDAGVAVLAAALDNDLFEYMKTIALNDNLVTDAGAALLAPHLAYGRHLHLEYCGLGQNPITDAGVAVCLEAMLPDSCMQLNFADTNTTLALFQSDVWSRSVNLNTNGGEWRQYLRFCASEHGRDGGSFSEWEDSEAASDSSDHSGTAGFESQ